MNNLTFRPSREKGISKFSLGTRIKRTRNFKYVSHIHIVLITAAAAAAETNQIVCHTVNSSAMTERERELSERASDYRNGVTMCRMRMKE